MPGIRDPNVMDKSSHGDVSLRPHPSSLSNDELSPYDQLSTVNVRTRCYSRHQSR